MTLTHGAAPRPDAAPEPSRLVRLLRRTQTRYMLGAMVFVMFMFPLMLAVHEAELRAVGTVSGRFDPLQFVVDIWRVHPASFVVAVVLGGAIPGWVFGRLRDATERALAEIEDVQRTQIDFLSVVSHEMRTPLTGIQGFSELIAEEDPSPEEIREFARDINESARRLDRLIGDLLDLQRLDRGRLSVTLSSMDLAATARSTARSLEGVSSQHHLVLDLQGSLPVRGDKDRLRQVVTNLVGNALKYATPGAVTVSGAVEGDLVHLRVADAGPGIAAASCERIFEQYYRVPSAVGAEVKGTGLGLPIVRGLVELHGGQVWCESDTGRGSVFHVVLPIDPAVDDVAADDRPAVRIAIS